MTKLLFLAITGVLWGLGAFAQNALPLEQDLSRLMLDQKDELFYQQGVIPAGDSSSLCGPTSAINWLQLKVANQAYPKKDLVRLVKLIGDQAPVPYKGINSGMTEPELVKFMDAMNEYLKVQIQYEVKGRSTITETDLLSDHAQILLLKYAEVVQAPEPPSRGGPRVGGPRGAPTMWSLLPHEDNSVRGFHFVLKVKADKATGELWLIDPENPSVFTKVKLSTLDGALRLRPLSRDYFPQFRFGVPLTWSVMSAIQERN